jgi:glycosyltransferase involved in cell wall biosynthesis
VALLAVNPTVTVVIPTIPGREDMLARAVRSVQLQKRKADALIVERDFWRTGAAATRERALAKVDTEWVAWLDDDDELLPSHLDVLLRHAVKSGADLVYSTPRMADGVDPTAVLIDGWWKRPWGVPFTEQSARHIRERGSFIPITHLVRRDLAARVGFPAGRTLPTGRYQGEDERYLIALLDIGVTFSHVDTVTWLWHGGHGGNTAGRRAAAH